jgi:hypothetical protein
MKKTVQFVLLIVPVNFRSAETSNEREDPESPISPSISLFGVKLRSITAISIAPERIKFSAISMLVLHYLVEK